MKLGRRGFFRLVGGAAAAIATKPLHALAPVEACKGFIVAPVSPAAALEAYYRAKFDSNVNMKLKIVELLRQQETRRKLFDLGYAVNEDALTRFQLGTLGFSDKVII